MKIFGMAGLAIAAALLAGTAMAQGPGGGMGMGSAPGFGGHRPPMERAFGPQGDRGRWWNNPKVVEQLKLTDAQRKSFDGILLEHREKLIDLRANVEKAELEMEPLMSADQPNEGRVISQIDKVAQARAELEKANARFLLAIRSKLTPEQWKQVQAFRANHGPERGGREFDRPGRGPKGPVGPAHGPQGQGGPRRLPMPPPPDMMPPPPDIPPEAEDGPQGAEPQAPPAAAAEAKQ